MRLADVKTVDRTSDTRRWQAAGLFFVTFCTLVLEVLDTRLLSVLTWYHLSFFAVSVAMLGMAAGAVFVFVQEERFGGDRAPAALATYAVALSVVLPLSHLANLHIPIGDTASLRSIASLVLATVALTAPFFLSGVVVTLALTRLGGSIGLLYFYDLLGASLGCLVVVLLLNHLNVTSVAFVAGAAAAAGAYCFQRLARAPGQRATVALAVCLVALAAVNDVGPGLIRVRFAKSRWLPPVDRIDTARWNSHSFILIRRPEQLPLFYWGPGARASRDRASIASIVIDGEAGTALTHWDGSLDSLKWVEHDVTYAPYVLRHGAVGVIGVGGGRDILSALRSGSTRITGIEINGILLDTIRRSHADFAGVRDRPEVTLVHDEARSFLSRTAQRFDVLQMSLIDTWAATGAGAFTLTENGLYTIEAWRAFLNTLEPTGIFSVSRWFSPERVSETTRLVGLGMAALLDKGVAEPRQHLILLARKSIATLMLSPAPFTTGDAATIRQLAADEDFTIVISPWTTPATEQMVSTVNARSRAELDAALYDPDLDYLPPVDERPFFFNLLKLRSFARQRHLPYGGVLWGNIAATTTLAALAITASVLVLAIIVVPLLAVGAPARQIPGFAPAIVYFGTIGAGYMFIQIAYLQRFSVFLGHPTYTFAVILFSMILFTGIGSFFSDRLLLDRAGSRYWALPLAIAAVIAVQVATIGNVTAAATPQSLGVRSAVVLLYTGPLSLLLGCCFPIGMRLVNRGSNRAAAWMWGINGACGVLASIAAVVVSMSFGIDASLAAAAVMYAALIVPMRALVNAVA